MCAKRARRGDVDRAAFIARSNHVLAQHLRPQTTRRWGTLWTIDGGPLALLEGCAARDANPTRRAFALIALQDTYGFHSAPYLADAEPLVRLAAARCLRVPAGVSESQAALTVSALTELLEDERPAYRAAGAGALGAWVFREDELSRLLDAADSDPDPDVREAALAALGAVHSLRARERLTAVLLDPQSPQSARDAALRGLARTGIVPDAR